MRTDRKTEKGKDACENVGQLIPDHFIDVNKMVELGSGAEREVDDIRGFQEFQNAEVAVQASEGARSSPARCVPNPYVLRC